MTLLHLQQEAAALTPVEQRKFVAFLVSLQTEKDEEFRSRLATKIDDNDPAHWMDLEDLKARLDAEPQA